MKHLSERIGFPFPFVFLFLQMLLSNWAELQTEQEDGE